MNIQQIIQNFEHKNFDEASLDFFKHLNVPLNRLIEESIDVNDLLGEHKDFSIIDTTYMVGGIDDNIFQGHKSSSDLKIKRYEGLLVFAISLNISTPSRTQLSAISRIFNRKFEYTPVVILFKYANKLSLSNTQRQEYKQHWRDGEKVGKVSILRDIDIVSPHRGHLDILQNMKITSKVTDYESLYNYWQEVFDVSLLNKKFYQELSNWYSYAVSEVVFPNQPKDTENVEEHKSQNVIRLLTRFLFVWFIKEKGLIPNEIFDEEYITEKLKDFNPKNMDGSLFGGHDKSSLYYKAILQNLFFASLNCPIKPLDSNDTRERGFRKKEHYGQNRDANFLMRYEDSFHNPQEFLELINQYVPFLNGGLFECLDDKTNGIYVDGFSDNLVKPHKLIVPDYLFFGVEEHVDLSTWYGSKNKSFKEATVKGLIKILDTYKFTVSENTPLDEDVALDPELLGRVFENLLASYNPETKSTARKQTGSFYTPREIVSYMVDESLIAYLKTKLEDEDDKLEENIRELCSYSDKQPFENEKVIIKLINALDNLKALDPAVGSGAFPMGMLQKMVYILSKLDPDNSYWQELQLDKAKKESDDVFETKNKEEREKLLIEINNTFDETINNPDYARKLYIIENSIYGVDIQSIAIQISKLRFFISLVIEQKIDRSKANFGVRPLPNLETKFIAANTLMGIDTQEKSLIDFDEIIKELEKELKNIRHRLFSAKTPQTKRKLRAKDKELREKISEELIKSGWNKDTAEKLAHWDPYEQNVSSEFFDMEWMFGISNGFDIVIGNPPYVQLREMPSEQQEILNNSKYKKIASGGRINMFQLFIPRSIDLTKEKGVISLITQNSLLGEETAKTVRDYIYKHTKIIEFSSFPERDNSAKRVFEKVKMSVCVSVLQKKAENENNKYTFTLKIWKERQMQNVDCIELNLADIFNLFPNTIQIPLIKEESINILKSIKIPTIKTFTIEANAGEIDMTKYKHLFKDSGDYRVIHGAQVLRYRLTTNPSQGIVNYLDNIDIVGNNRAQNLNSSKRIIMQRITGVDSKIRLVMTLSCKQCLCANSTNYISDIYTHSIEYILSVLNSKLINFYYKLTSTNTNITAKEINSIPIPSIDKKDDNLLAFLINLVYISINHNELRFTFEYIIDSIVFELYFSTHMKEKKINIIEFVEQDINEIMGSTKLEGLSHGQKEQIIQKLYDKWTHPDNEVRNRMKLFSVRSPDILKPILES